MRLAPTAHSVTAHHILDLFQTVIYHHGPAVMNARIMGDVNAVKKGKVGKRVARRVAGKVTGRGLGKLFK